MIAEKMATLKHGDNQHKKEEGQKCPSSLEHAAKALSVGKRTVKQARTVKNKGDETVSQAVTEGKLPVSTAEELVKAVPDKTKQAEILAKGPHHPRNVNSRLRRFVYL